MIMADSGKFVPYQELSLSKHTLLAVSSLGEGISLRVLEEELVPSMFFITA